MYKLNQSGRSMIEMLGVLSVVGVLSVGGLTVVNNAQQKKNEGQLISDTAQLAMISKKLACQYDAAYTTYTKYLNRSEAIPTNLTYNSTSDQIEGVMDSITKITGNDKYFAVSVEGLDDSSCIKMATTDWGKRYSNGCLGVSIGATDLHTCMLSGNCSGTASAITSSDANYPMSAATAATHCANNNNTVKIWFKACR